MNNKRFVNGNTNMNRIHAATSSKIDSWVDQQQPPQQFQPNNTLQQQQTRKQTNKFQSNKHQTNKFYNNYKTGASYNNNNNNNNSFKLNEDCSEQMHRANNNNNNMDMTTYASNGGHQYDQNDSIATVPINNDSSNKIVNDLKPSGSFVPCVSVEHSINESLPSDDSIIINGGQENSDLASCSPSNSNNEICNNEDTTSKSGEYYKNESSSREDCMLTNEEMSQNAYGQQVLPNNYYPCNPAMIQQPHLVEYAPSNDCNGNGVYAGGMYEYDYSANCHPQLIPQGQASQYYVYHPYHPDYANVANGAAVVSMPNGSPLSTSTTGTPQQQTTTFYAAYPTMPSYIYDPNTGYTNMVSTYSPVQGQQLQQAPAILSSPQHQSTILASYQTPPQPQHQLYMSPSSMTPPASISPNDTASGSNSSTTTIANERSSNCNSPQVSTGLPNAQLTQTPAAQTTTQISQSPYLIYPGSNPYLTPQAFQSPMPTQAFMMYPPPPPQPQSGNFQPNQTLPNSQPNTPLITPPYTNPNRYNKHRSNRFNNNNNYHKRNFNQRYQSYSDQSPQCPNLTYSPVENCYYNSTPMAAQQAPCYDETVTDEAVLVDQNMAMYPPPPLPYCDNGANYMMSLPVMPNGEAMPYEYDTSGIVSYGDEYVDNNEDNGDDNDEQLACNICRGRRMCFCYFLKVRYYKFPSFFDLVDHQYKKWRSSMVKAKKA